jgi:hypothetical protein
MLTAFFKSNRYKRKLEEAKKDEDFPSFKSDAPSDNPLFIRKKAKLSYKDKDIRKLVAKNVIEVTFKRRLWPIVSPASWQKKNTRRMLCTANWKFVQKNKKFKFRPPKGIRPRTKGWYKKRKLVIVWDLILLDWRMISLDDYDVVNVFEADTKKNQETFLKNYTNLLKKGRNKLKQIFNK